MKVMEKMVTREATVSFWKTMIFQIKIDQGQFHKKIEKEEERHRPQNLIQFQNQWLTLNPDLLQELE